MHPSKTPIAGVATTVNQLFNQTLEADGRPTTTPLNGTAMVETALFRTAQWIERYPRQTPTPSS